MVTLKNENRSFSSDIDYHLSEIEKDLNRVKFENNRNIFFLRLFDNLLDRIRLIKELSNREPKTYFNAIYSEMKRLFKKAFGELDGFHIVILFKKDANPERIGFIKLRINKKLLNDEK